MTSVSWDVCGTFSLISSVVPCPRSVLVPWVDSGIAQGRILSPLLFNLLIESLAVTLRSAIPGVSFSASDSFRHVCQFHPDDLVVLAASLADLQMALDAVHAWGVRWRFSFGVGPPHPPLWSSVLCAAALTAVLTSVAFPCPWSNNTGLWASSSPPLSLGALTSTFSAPAMIVSFTRPVLGALVKVSLSPSLLPFSSPMFSRALLLVSSSMLTILLPSSNSCSHSVAGVATFSDGPAPPLLLQFTGNLASVMLCTLPLGALSRFSGACVLSTMPPLALRSLPVCSGSRRLRWAPGHTGANLLSTFSPSRSLPTLVSLLAHRPRHSTGGSPEKSVLVCTVPFVTDSLPRYLIYMASWLTPPLTTSSLSGRTPCTPITCLFLPFVFGVLPAGAMTTPSTGRPSRHWQGSSTCPFCHDTDGSLMHHLSACLSHHSAQLSLFFRLKSVSRVCSHLDGIRDVSEALFQPRLPNHIPAMTLRVNLVLGPQCLPWYLFVQTRFLPWSYVILRLPCPALDRLEVLLTSSFSDWGPTLSLFFELRRSALQMVFLVLLPVASTYLVIWPSFPLVVLSCRFSARYLSLQRARNTA